MDDTSAPVIPVHCQPPLYRCSKEIARKYINYNSDLSFTIGVPVPCCHIESTHLLKTMGCRFKPHKPCQPGFFHGLIDKLTSSACAELTSENVLDNVFSSAPVPGAVSVDLLIKVTCSSLVTNVVRFFPFFIMFNQ